MTNRERVIDPRFPAFTLKNSVNSVIPSKFPKLRLTNL